MCDYKNLGVTFESGEAGVKMPWFSLFSKNVSTINLRIFPNHDVYIQASEKIQQAFWRDKGLRSL